MTIEYIYNLLDQISPFTLQEKWDNSGLNVGELNSNIENIYLSLDIDSQLLNSIEPNSLIITHHPLIFSPLKNFNQSRFPANIITKMVNKNISLISMHTNFDKTHLNKYVCEKVLELEIISHNEFICEFKIEKDFDIFYHEVSKRLNLEFKKSVKTKEYLKNGVLITGSGASMIPQIKADCLLTGDIKYHDAMLAKEVNLSLIDIGHYESEKYFVDILHNILNINSISAIITNSKNPFSY